MEDGRFGILDFRSEIADPSESKSVERFGSWGSGFSPVAESVSFWTGGSWNGRLPGRSGEL